MKAGAYLESEVRWGEGGTFCLKCEKEIVASPPPCQYLNLDLSENYFKFFVVLSPLFSMMSVFLLFCSLAIIQLIALFPPHFVVFPFKGVRENLSSHLPIAIIVNQELSGWKKFRTTVEESHKIFREYFFILTLNLTPCKLSWSHDRPI